MATLDRPLACLSLDLDNEWSYLKAHADAAWKDYPSYLHIVVPRILSVLDELGLKITFFIVGRDAACEEHRDILSSIVEAGHAIGNHSNNHEPWLHRYTVKEIEDDLMTADEAIEHATGVRPRGFRGPGYSINDEVLTVLSRHGYLFDSSTMPTIIGPLARAYLFWKSSFDREEKEERALLFGSFHDGLRPLKPYRWGANCTGFLELPLTTYPFVRLPFNVSYVLYLSTFSPIAAVWYWRSALQFCKFNRLEPNLLLHPLDFLGKGDVATLTFFPGMDIPTGVKLDRVREYLTYLKLNFEVLSINMFAEIVNRRSHLVTRKPDFRLSIVPDFPRAHRLMKNGISI